MTLVGINRANVSEVIAFIVILASYHFMDGKMRDGNSNATIIPTK
jgi:hypothetical protein